MALVHALSGLSHLASTFPTHSPTNSPTPSILKKHHCVALITHCTCRGYMQWVKIHETPCQMMLQMWNVHVTSQGAQNLKFSSIAHGGETRRNHFGFRESWSWKQLVANRVLERDIAYTCHILAWYYAIWPLGLTPQKSPSPSLPCLTKQTV